jgi:uncharacterized lipoprotein YajG
MRTKKKNPALTVLLILLTLVLIASCSTPAEEESTNPEAQSAPASDASG